MATVAVVLGVLVTALLLPRLERRRRTARTHRRRAERRVELLETARSLPGHDLADAARLSCRGLRTLGFDAAAVTVRRGEVVEPLHVDGMPRLAEPIAAADSVASRCLDEDRTLVVRDYQAEPRHRAERREWRSVVLTPVRVDGRPVACLNAARKHVAEPTAEEVVIAETVAVHLGRAFAVAADVAAQEQLLDRMRQLEQLRSGFLAEISDELSDALTALRGRTNSLLEQIDRLDEERRCDLLHRLDCQVEGLRRTIDALLDFSRFQAGRPQPTLRSLTVARLLGPLVDRGRIRVEGDLGSLPPVRVDEDRVRHALELLFGLGGHTGALEVWAGDGVVRLRLADGPVAPEGVVGALVEQLLVSGGAALDPERPVEILLEAIAVEVGR